MRCSPLNEGRKSVSAFSEDGQLPFEVVYKAAAEVNSQLGFSLGDRLKKKHHKDYNLPQF